MNESAKPYSQLFSPKHIFGTIVLYALLVGFLFWADKNLSIGSCNPSVSQLIILIVPFFSAIFFIITLIYSTKGRKYQIIPAILHGLVLITLILMRFYDRK
jgi:hypothetical protein